MRNYFPFFILLMAFVAPAQSDPLADPDIVWAAEIEHDWNVEFEHIQDEQNADVVTLTYVLSEGRE